MKVYKKTEICCGDAVQIVDDDDVQWFNVQLKVD